jgi:hypothetical protein
MGQLLETDELWAKKGLCCIGGVDMGALATLKKSWGWAGAGLRATGLALPGIRQVPTRLQNGNDYTQWHSSGSSVSPFDRKTWPDVLT